MHTRHPKSLTNSKKPSQNPFREGLETQSWKRWFLGHPWDLPMCLRHHACHAFCTFHKVASEHPFPDFGSPFGTLSAPMGTQMAPRKLKRSIHKTHKKTSPKRYQHGLQKELNPDQIQTKSRPFWHHFGTLDREWAPGPIFFWFRIDFWRFGRLFYWNYSFWITSCDTDSLLIPASVSTRRHTFLMFVYALLQKWFPL